MKSLAYRLSKDKHSLFYYHSLPERREEGRGGGGVGVHSDIISIYMDDVIIIVSNTTEAHSHAHQLTWHLRLNTWPTVVFHGLGMTYTTMDTFICQQKYTLDLQELCKLGLQQLDTLIEANYHLAATADAEPIDQGSYQKLFSKLIYLTTLNLALLISQGYCGP